ncbi:WD40 repeat-like protein [Ascodesmis nigricans]|uniref:WD40 repeat-like protein n=1 Tax=Ascodesmis nigricans TaxID=341454 RepID=A0A4S2MNL9_9PEZI|nr:WD40 repeat-like protein [Ascodesmis nigricans]
MDPPTTMNPIPRRTSSSRHTDAASSSTTTNSSVTRPPLRTTAQNHRRRMVTPQSTVAQFSFLPTTQTTVVTTTTTTTTSFPQMVMKPPRNLNRLDPKEYPLASQPTPPTLKRFCFEVDGKPTYFKEADDAEESVRKLDSLVHELSRNNGSIRTEWQGEERYVRPGEPSAPSTFLSSAQSRKRPASPTLINDAVTTITRAGSNAGKRRHTQKSRPTSLNKLNTPSPSKKNSRSSRTNTPITTSHECSLVQRATRPMHSQLSQLQNSTPLLSPLERMHPLSQQETPLTLSPQMMPTHLDDGDVPMEMNSPPAYTPHQEPERAIPLPGATVSAPEDGTADVSTPSLPPLSTAPPLSLPSPSLSPVTAAALHGNHGTYFPALDTHEEVTSPLDLDRMEDDEEEEIPELVRTPQRGISQLDVSHIEPSPGPPGGLMSLPTMLDVFDSFAPQVQNYVMYQLLRRCSKNTLQTVASVVNPALKCDFLTLLPTELAFQVIGNLDVKSLCNAAQVSKAWRKLIDTDEWTWKKLFDADGYQLQEGELDRAVREGWGYQDPMGDNSWEMDINTNISRIASLSGTGSRGKASRKTRAMSKQARKKRENFDNLERSDFKEVVFDIVSNSIGPIAAAEAAEKAGHRASLGLPSLQNLHLFKSIYRRHHIIRRSWIQPDVKPKHISFRGHSEQDRHVVTCLQFDTDKILTGSDDTNINVYDTSTGALRKTLEGHEGGVWALQYEGNILVSGSTDRTVRVWNIKEGTCMQIFHGHTSTVRCLQILMPTKVGTDSDGKDIVQPKVPLIITGSRDSTLRIWKLPSETSERYLPSGNDTGAFVEPQNNPYHLRVLQGHNHSVRAISAHGDTLVSGSYDYTVKVWKISSGECVHDLEGHTQKVYSVVYDHKRNRCISGSMDNLVKVWSLDTGTCIYNLEGHTQLVGLLDLSHDKLVSAAADWTLRIWDPETGQCKHTLSAHTGAITCFQHDAHKVISGSEQTLKMWNVKTGEFIRNLLTDLTGVWQVRFNERRCVAAVQRENITYIEVLDFGAARDGVPEKDRGRRIVVDRFGNEVMPPVEVEAGEDVDGMV